MLKPRPNRAAQACAQLGQLLVKCYNPVGSTSKEKYAWISKHLANAVEEAIKIRKEN